VKQGQWMGGIQGSGQRGGKQRRIIYQKVLGGRS
jgi:hypothetical protein